MLALKRAADEVIAQAHAERAELEKAHAPRSPSSRPSTSARSPSRTATSSSRRPSPTPSTRSDRGAQGRARAGAERARGRARQARSPSSRPSATSSSAACRRRATRIKRSEGELASAVQTIADRNAELRAHAAAIAERDQRIAELRKEIEAIEAENTSYQEQVLRAYQKIKTDEAMVARARKAMAIALTVLDDQGNPPTMEGPGFTPGPGNRQAADVVGYACAARAACVSCPCCHSARSIASSSGPNVARSSAETTKPPPCCARCSASVCLELVGLVPHEDARLLGEAEVAEDLVDRADLLIAIGIARVDDVDEQVGVRHLLERGAERARRAPRADRG